MEVVPEMELPAAVREKLVMSVDEYIETVNDDPDASSLAEFVIAALCAAAEETGVEDAEDLVINIEEEAALDESFVETLELEFTNNDEIGLTGEEIVSLMEKVAGISWKDADGDGFGDDEDPFAD
jgi:uncharacterized protein (DUF1778 family)